MVALYNFFLLLYGVIIRIVLPFNPKAKAWIDGRKYWRETLSNIFQQLSVASDQTIWMHCASLGEFEQGRPVLEELRIKNKGLRIVVSFFSPSGYEQRKDWPGADIVCYLPLDSARAARDFIRIVNPSLAIFVKYEFWYHYLATLSSKKIPAILISAAFREGQPFFKWWGGLWRKMLGFYEAVFVQDSASAKLIDGLTKEIVIAGDTRYDRVSAIAAAAESYPVIEAFKDGGKLIVAGSTWPEDEHVLREITGRLPDNWKLVIAPHEIDESHLAKIEALFGARAIRYSGFKRAQPQKDVLVIDNIGLLSSLYRYGELAFVGGGFNKGGIHNVLEPAVYGLPVVIGPVYQKFVEAVEMVDSGFVFPVKDGVECLDVFLMLMEDENKRSELERRICSWMRLQTGATTTITTWIDNRRKANFGALKP